jgi:hypothetical protein
MTIISLNSSLSTSIKKYRESLEVRLKSGINEFFTNWSENILAMTPVGDADKYIGFYRKRYKQYGWKPEEGMLIANWNIGINSSDYNMSGFYSGLRADYSTAKLADKATRLLSSTKFKLGDRISIWNAVPYVKDIAVRGTKGQQVVNLEADALDIVQALFKSTFKV